MKPSVAIFAPLLFCLLASCGKEDSADRPPTPDFDRLEEEARQIEIEADELRSRLTEILTYSGTQSMARYLRSRAEEGLDLTPLREFILMENNGEPERVPVHVPPNAELFVDFANRQLAESGIDFLVIDPVEDPTLPSIDRPIPGQEALYQKWKEVRLATVPFAGFAVTLLEVARGAARPELIASLVRAFLFLGLEAQFIIFTTEWSRVWGQDRSLITWRWETQSQRLEAIAQQLNELLDATKGVKLSHFYNYMVTWGVTLLLYASDYLTMRAIAPGAVKFSLRKFIAGSWVITTGAFAAMGLTQVATSNAAKRGEISEYFRFQMETISGAWIAFWRIAGIATRMRVLGRVMLYSFGAAVSVPLLLKNEGASPYARETAALFRANAGERIDSGDLQRLFSDVYDLVPYTRQTTLKDVVENLIIRQQPLTAAVF